MLKRVGKALICVSLEKDDEESSKEIENFLRVLELWEDLVFGEAIYETNNKKQIKLRRPQSLPNERDVQAIREAVLKIIAEDTKDLNSFTESRFVRLRDAVCTRLTLLNGRRGGEPARVFVTQWKDAKGNGWIDPQRVKGLDQLDQILIANLKVMYMTGKGTHFILFYNTRFFIRTQKSKKPVAV